jgi:hypothetical protein
MNTKREEGTMDNLRSQKTMMEPKDQVADEEMSDAERAFKAERLRREAITALEHADALESYGRTCRRSGDDEPPEDEEAPVH